jgi:hypothetical protein
MSKKRVLDPTPEQLARREQELEDLKSVMRTQHGRRLLWRILSDANMFRSCFTGNSTTFYLEGKRDVVLPYYQDIMQACPELFWQAQQENKLQEGSINARPDESDPDNAGNE